MSSNRTVLVVLFTAALGSAACSGNESSPLEPSAQPPAYSEWVAQSASNGQNGQQGNWGNTKKSSCNPLSARTVAQDIGPQGGVLHIGPHTLTVLPGALRLTTRITGTITADTVNSVQFAPEGLHFVIPAVLSLSYSNCKVVSTSPMKVAYTTNDLVTLLELVPSQDVKVVKTVVGFIGHFSRYAVAY